MSPDPSEVLAEVRDLTQQGRYAEALEQQLWYHEHAQPAVRLSFGLSAWAKLAALYPPAREALIAVRDRNAAAIRDGDTSFARFHELAAIGSYLQDEAVTGEVFLTLRMNHPKVAARYYKFAEKGLIACQEYRVCASFIPDATARFVRIRLDRRFLLSNPPDPISTEQTVAFREQVETRFAEDILRLIEILTAVGRTTEAERVRQSALAETESESARAAIAGSN